MHYMNNIDQENPLRQKINLLWKEVAGKSTLKAQIIDEFSQKAAILNVLANDPMEDLLTKEGKIELIKSLLMTFKEQFMQIEKN